MPLRALWVVYQLRTIAILVNISRLPNYSEKVFVSQERVSGFPEKGADLRGSSPNFRGSLGNYRGSKLSKFGKLPGKLRIAVRFHSERTSVEVAENFRGSRRKLPGRSRDFPEARGGKKTNRHKQLRGIVPEMGGGQIVYVFPLFLGKKGNT